MTLLLDFGEERQESEVCPAGPLLSGKTDEVSIANDTKPRIRGDGAGFIRHRPRFPLFSVR